MHMFVLLGDYGFFILEHIPMHIFVTLGHMSYTFLLHVIMLHYIFSLHWNILQYALSLYSAYLRCTCSIHMPVTHDHISILISVTLDHTSIHILDALFVQGGFKQLSEQREATFHGSCRHRKCQITARLLSERDVTPCAGNPPSLGSNMK